MPIPLLPVETPSRGSSEIQELFRVAACTECTNLRKPFNRLNFTSSCFIELKGRFEVIGHSSKEGLTGDRQLFRLLGRQQALRPSNDVEQ